MPGAQPGREGEFGGPAIDTRVNPERTLGNYVYEVWLARLDEPSDGPWTSDGQPNLRVLGTDNCAEHIGGYRRYLDAELLQLGNYRRDHTADTVDLRFPGVRNYQ